MRKQVLFLCTGNSCRSQMAEALVNTLYAEQWTAFSAGTRPTGFVHPLALAVLNEIGINHNGRSKIVDEFLNKYFDKVITVCDSAAEDCPLWLGTGIKTHYSFPDPAINGEIQDFRQVRDSILQALPELLS